MKSLFLDFESYYDDIFSLKRMTPIEYILDPRFEALGCAFIYDNQEPYWVDGPDLGEHLRSFPWSEIFAVSHNALFDMLILSLRYGVIPAFYGDTLSMARNQVSHATGRSDLDTVAKYFQLPAKWDTVTKTKGINFRALASNPALYEEVQKYACDDAEKCRRIFIKMVEAGFPKGQLEVIDMVVRLATQPQLELDPLVLSEHLATIRAKKAQLLADCHMDGSQANISSLMSDQQFAAKLMFLGLNDIPRKVSPKTGKESYAFAKTDKQFTELLEHYNPMVQALVAARLGHKSTLEESRTERLMSIARLTTRAPVPLKYSGAHTHRFSGDWKINLQNLPNGSDLRRAFKAPKGYVVLSVDASQIEARLNAVHSKQWDLVDDFRKGIDVYAKFAERIYGYTIHKKAHPKERFVGKTSILSLGYGSSWPVFQNMCRVKGDVILTDRDAAEIVGLYRGVYRAICDNWTYGTHHIIPAMSRGAPLKWGPVVTEKQAILLPDGNKLRYRDLRHDFDQKLNKYAWSYMRGQLPQRIYGAKMVENIIQALAFIHIMAVALSVKNITKGYVVPAHQVHDELIYVVLERHAEEIKELVIRVMSTPPWWMPDAPLAAEGNYGATYADTK